MEKPTTCPITSLSSSQAAEVLGRAFVDDPVSVAVYQNFSAERRERALFNDFTEEIPLCIRKGNPIQVNQGGKVVAAAVIYPPGAYPLPAYDSWKLLLKSILMNGLYNIRSWIKWLNQVDKYHPTEAHYYLEYLGVDPVHQGKGFGSLLLKTMTLRADEVGVGCYLENANPRNISFYQKSGFQIIREMEIIGLPAWFMWRPPGNS
jgi:ribosomal protein S18 acetylase RimI-like enzyme